MKIAAIQTDIVWERPVDNLLRVREMLGSEVCAGVEIAIVPEMFSTGFSMRSEVLAETVDGPTVTALRALSGEFQIALAGSFIATEGGRFYNRGFFVMPDGTVLFYDKRHLFSMGGEDKHFSAGTERLVIDYRGWRICPLICYDLRFPVWSRNRDNAYDLLIYVANWPAARRRVWDVLLRARAIENQCFVAGVNRTGTDGAGVLYDGGSTIIDAKGDVLAEAINDVAAVVVAELDLEALRRFRSRFPAWRDAD
jgi:predicted amidohydrolase